MISLLFRVHTTVTRICLEVINCDTIKQFFYPADEKESKEKNLPQRNRGKNLINKKTEKREE